MSRIAELVDRMLKEEYVCYSPILEGVINIKQFSLGFFNTEEVLFLTTEEFGRKPYRLVRGERRNTIECMDDDIDIEYQQLIMRFDISL